jgi:hypothetical protein
MDGRILVQTHWTDSRKSLDSDLALVNLL